MTDPADIRQALSWSTRLVELDRKAAFLDTHAQLLGKVGRKAEAVVVEQEALEKAREASEETADYQKTLAALKSRYVPELFRPGWVAVSMSARTTDHTGGE